MKRCIAIGLGIVAVLSACSTFPAPQSDTDSLVVANVVLDYPDGFFNLGPRTITRGVRLEFENRDTGQTHRVLTSDGYVSFAAEGGASYRLVRYEYEADVADITYTVSRPVGIDFDVRPASIVYLGDIAYTYNLPQRTATDNRGSSRTQLWNFEVEMSVTSDEDSLIAYVAEQDAEGAWSAYPVYTSAADRWTKGDKPQK